MRVYRSIGRVALKGNRWGHYSIFIIIKEMIMESDFKQDVKDKDREFDRLFRKWKRGVERSGILQDLRTREYFEKPSVKRHRTKQTQKRRNEIERKREKMELNRRRHGW